MQRTKLFTKNFIVITLINFFMFFSFQLFPTALPPYIRSLGIADDVIGWIQGIMTIAILIIRPFVGVALDKYGRKKIFIVGLIGMSICSFAYSFFTTVILILAIRFMHGLVWGISNTACNTIASDNIERKRFAEGMAYFSLTGSIALAIAPAIALSLDINDNITLAIISLLISILLVFAMKYHDLNKVEKLKNKKEPMYAREAIFPSIIIFLMMITYGATITFIALYGMEKSIEGIGIFFSAYALSMIATRPFFGRAIDKNGFSIGIWSGVICIPIALILLSLSNNLFMFIVCAIIYGVGIGAAQLSLQTMAIVCVSKKRAGSANATFFTGFDAGIGLGAVLSGIISSNIGYGNMFALISVFPIIAGVLYTIFIKVGKKEG